MDEKPATSVLEKTRSHPESVRKSDAMVDVETKVEADIKVEAESELLTQRVENRYSAVENHDNTGFYWQTSGVRFSARRDQGALMRLIHWLYRYKSRVLRTTIRKLMWHYIGRHYQWYSQTLRRIFATYHRVEVGLYSHGGCFIPRAFPPGTRIGRYCSIAVSATAQSENHPMNLKSSHAFFFNPALGHTRVDIVPHTNLTIGNDVWLGTNAIILPSCSKIGDGAVVGAGSVVNKNIPPYAIVVGNPARVVRYRFSKEVIEELLAAKWWDKPIEELRQEMESFQTPLEGEAIR